MAENERLRTLLLYEALTGMDGDGERAGNKACEGSCKCHLVGRSVSEMDHGKMRVRAKHRDSEGSIRI